jgi:hypothetical protein
MAMMDCSVFRREYFDEQNDFLFQDVDSVTGNDIIRKIAVFKGDRTLQKMVRYARLPLVVCLSKPWIPVGCLGPSCQESK